MLLVRKHQFRSIGVWISDIVNGILVHGFNSPIGCEIVFDQPSFVRVQVNAKINYTRLIIEILNKNTLIQISSTFDFQGIIPAIYIDVKGFPLIGFDVLLQIFKIITLFADSKNNPSNEALKERINVIKKKYPQIISEAEPTK